MYVKAFDPHGILGVKIISATGLPKKGGFRGGLRSLVGQDKPDTYVIAKLGAFEYTTSTLKNDQNPVWENDAWFESMLERPDGHLVRLIAYDEDTFSKDDFLGKVLLNVDDYLEALLASGSEGHEITLPFEDDENEQDKKHPRTVGGELTFNLKWMPLKPLHALDCDPTVAVISVFIYSCNNLVEMVDGSTPNGEEEGIPGAVIVNCNVGDLTPESTEVIKNTPHPNFEHSFTFKLEDCSNWNEKTISATVLDPESGGTFGNLEIQLPTIAEDPITRKVFSLNPGNPMVTITLSARMLFS